MLSSSQLIVSIFCVVVLCLSCHSLPKLAHPYSEAELEGVAIFLELRKDSEGFQSLSQGLHITSEEINARTYFKITGTGLFSIGDHECSYDAKIFVCGGLEMDKSLGGILFKRNGDIIPVNPLILLAR